MIAVNNVSKRDPKRIASQPSLWEEPVEDEEKAGPFTLDDFPVTLTLPFRRVNGDTSKVQGRQHYLLWGGTFVNHRLVSYYVNVLDCWIDQGVVYGRCLLWPEGRYIDELRAGEVSEEEDEEDL